MSAPETVGWDSELRDAVFKGNWQAVDKRLSGGFDVNCAVTLGVTLLHCAADHGDPLVVRRLLSLGADAMALDHDKESALHWAARGGHAQVAQCLAEAGADLQARNFAGRTPIELAALADKADMVSVLLGMGASITIESTKEISSAERSDSSLSQNHSSTKSKKTKKTTTQQVNPKTPPANQVEEGIEVGHAPLKLSIQMERMIRAWQLRQSALSVVDELQQAQGSAPAL